MQLTAKLVAIWLLLSCLVAHADEQPWRVGISPQQQADAQSLLDGGNALLLDNKFSEALEKYKQAVAIWEHPAIRFNMVRCLIQLDRPLDAAESLELALKYGAQPFEPTIYQEAIAFQKLLAKQVADLEVSCTQSGVEITLDGRSLLTCPGKQTKRLLPGQHQVVGTRQGFLPRTAPVFVLGGKRESVSITLEPLEAAGRITHRWRWWIPWAAIGGGVVLGGIGELVHLKAVSDNDAYRTSVDRFCTNRCATDDPNVDHDALSRARIENGIAIGVLATAGAVVATGAVMVVLNRGRMVYDAERAARVDIVPLGNGAAVVATRRF